MKLALLIPDGVGVRNFLLSDFLREATLGSNVSLYNNIPSEILPQLLPEACSKLQLEPLLPYRETPMSSTLRYSLLYAHMNWVDTQAMRFIRNLPVKGSWRRQFVDRAARGIGLLAKTPSRIAAIDNAHRAMVTRLPEYKRYRDQFQKARPTILFSSHQRPPGILPVVMAAQSLGIPTAVFIFSWDNLSSKGRMAASFDNYFVWSEHMRGELLRYYPHVSPSNVHVVGTPQFDIYSDSGVLLSREEFFRRIGADRGRPLICYSCGDSSTTPDEPRQIAVLMEHIRAGRITGNPQVLLRTSPADSQDRFKGLLLDFPEILFSPPQWLNSRPGHWDSIFPTREDVEFLANLTHHSDMNVNLASTMTLDFAIHDKPIVNIAFDVSDPPRFGVPLWEYYYQFEHYRPVVELKAARFARTQDELATHVNTYLNDPALDREGRRKLVALQVGVPIGQSSKKVFETLQNISAAGATR